MTSSRTSRRDRPDLAGLATSLRLAVARLARRLRREDRSGISHSMLSALSSLQHGPMTLKDLAAVEHVQPPTVTALIGKLEAAGLVAREADPKDGRVWRVGLRPEGQRLLDRVRSRRTAYLARRLRGVSDEEREVLARAAEIIERLAKDEA